jgi:hypothetical protein
MYVRFVPGRKSVVRPFCRGGGGGGREEEAHLIRVDALDEVVGAVERVLPAARRDPSAGQAK